ncbi:MAG: YggT family protein [Mesorhizobium sp.]|nr:MAG: YggT family protein [Mesorhizobium sp.]TJV68984.1 MAG: YggT family protein [Mesorhizobium sp.]
MIALTDTLIDTLIYALFIYRWIVIAAAIFSWLYAFNVVNSRNQFVSSVGNALYQMTEPVFRPIRRFMPDLGGVDISPLVVLVILFFLESILNSPIRRLFYQILS